VNDRSVTHLPLLERKAFLYQLLIDVPHSLIVSEIPENGVGLFQAATELKLEGIVAQRLAAAYRPGVRTGDWLKIKRPGAVPAERFKH
jgi:bifunctional non-homologous end joining protein LigD